MTTASFISLIMPVWATDLDRNLGMNVWSTDSAIRPTDTQGDEHTPAMYHVDALDGSTINEAAIFPIDSDISFTIREARKLAAAILNLCDLADREVAR